MPKPIVAVVGRPNVGKSTLFNHLVGQRISIVEDTPGVTRDRISADCTWNGRTFSLVDTGGIDPQSEDQLLLHMRRQAQAAIELADVILFMTDAKQGYSPDDEMVAQTLRKAGKPVLVVVNKVDSFPTTKHLEFFSLGLGDVLPISAANRMGLGDLLDEVVTMLPPADPDEDNSALRIAIVGKPNAGKSSLVNAILGEERVIVSDIPGTTRDAVDTPFAYEGEQLVLIDTAGIRRRSKVALHTIEQYSVLRAVSAIGRCDVAVLVIDAVQGVTEQDEKIAGLILEEGKPCVIAINKWDLLEKTTGTTEAFDREVVSKLHFLSFCPRITLSALTGQRLQKLLPLVQFVYRAACLRVPTGILNEWLQTAIAQNEPPSGPRAQRVRFYFATQPSVCPPTFVIKTNRPDDVHFSYQRYLENHLRKTFPLEGTPIRLLLRGRSEEE